MVSKLGSRQVAVAICAWLAACGGKTTVLPDEGTTASGSGGSSGVSQTGMAGLGMSEPPLPDRSHGSITGGGGTTITPCGPVECGPGLVCCNESCGVCTAPNEACDTNACPMPVVDAGPGLVVEGGPPCSGGGGDGPPKSDYGYAWKDSWFIRGCLTKVGETCVTVPVCPNTAADNFEDRGSVTTELFPIGASACATYSVTFQVNGIAELKYYQGGTRDGGETMPANFESADLDTFYRGGTPVISHYGVMRMRVLDSSQKEIARYYMNSAPESSGGESHRTFHLSYSKTIDVPGGGFVEYLTQDPDCISIDNCGDGNVADTVCNAARGIPHEEANPLPPTGIDPATHKSVALATLNSVNGSQKPWHSQIVHVTITKVLGSSSGPASEACPRKCVAK
jgi:hypothetical protein